MDARDVTIRRRCNDVAPLLTRHEVARVLGLRSLELSGGALPNVDVDESLKVDTLYVAALEMSEHKLDALIKRPGEVIDLRLARYPPNLYVLLDTVDGGKRSYTFLNQGVTASQSTLRTDLASCTAAV